MSGDVVELCACDRCAKPVAYDLDVPDDVWGRISPRPVDGWKSGGVLCPECIIATLIASQAAEIERLRDLADRLKLEAQGHASEARTANSTIYEIYQVLSGSKGEPGNWHGAEPARRYVETAERLLAEARAALEPFAALYDESMRDFPDGSAKSVRPDDKQAWGFNNADLTWGDFRRARTLTNGGENGR